MSVNQQLDELKSKMQITSTRIKQAKQGQKCRDGPSSSCHQDMGQTAKTNKPLTKIPSRNQVGAQPKRKHATHNRRKIVLRPVDYTWNRGGRLKEIRIRTQARKFLFIWMQKTFGQLTITAARKFHHTYILRKCLAVWKREWWDNCHEWKLLTKAAVHHRFTQCNSVWKAWISYYEERKEKKRKLQIAYDFYAQHYSCKYITQWKTYIRLRRYKKTMYSQAHAVAAKSRTASAWCTWRRAKQQKDEEIVNYEAAVAHLRISSQKNVWARWRARFQAATLARQAMATAGRHERATALRRALATWVRYTAGRRCKRQQGAIAVDFSLRRVKRDSMRTWLRRYAGKEEEYAREREVAEMSSRSVKRRSWMRWMTYVDDMYEERRKCALANIHYKQRLTRRVLNGLQLARMTREEYDRNVCTARLFRVSTLKRRAWGRWMERMEETEDAELHELLAIGHQHFKYKAQKKAFGVFTSYLRWRRKRKSDVIKAETHFIVQALPKCFSQWQSFTEVEKVKNSNRRKATDFHTEVLLTKYYFEWWRRMEQVCEARTMERMAVMQRDETLLRCHLRVWIVRTRAVLSENRKDAVARVHYRKLIARGAWRAWHEVVVTSATRRRRFEFAVTYHQQALASDAWLSWRRYVRARRVKMERRADADEYCARCVLRRAVDSWKLYRDQARRRATEAEGRMAAKRRSELRAAWNEWKVETKRLKRKRIGREMATRHRRSVLASVVFTRWREWSAVRIHTRARADERVTAARRQLDRGQLRAAFGRWRAQHQTRRAEQAKTRDAARHHAAKVCAVALQAWRLYRYLSLRKALLRRQADNFSARRLLHDSAARWKRRLQWRREERALTVDALWHWALSLQCKMLDRWRRYAEERRSKRERYEEAMEERRRAMLRSGCRKMLEYNADMIGVTTKLQATRQARTRYSAYHLAWKYGKRWIESVRIRMREDRKKIRSESTWMPPVPISEDEERLITWSASHRMETTRPDHHDSTVTRPDHHDSTVTRPGPRLPRFLDESLQRDGIFFESATTTTSDHSTRDSVDDSGFRPSPLDRSLQDSPSPRGDHHVLRSRDHVLLPPSAFALPSSSSPPRILLTPDSLLEDGGRRSSQDDDVIVTTSQQGATSMTFVASPSTSRDSVRDELRRIHAQLGEFQHLKRQLKVLKQQKEILLRWATGDGGHARSSSTDSSMLSESMVEHEVAQVSREIEQTASELIERRPEVEKLALRVRVLCARPNS